MNCRYSEETLALFIEGDVSEKEAGNIRHHLTDCVKCRNVYERLRNSQAFFKSRFVSNTEQTIDRQTLAEVRHGVMARIHRSESAMDWRTRIERAVWRGYRKTGFAFAGVALVGVFAVILLSQGYRPTQAAGPIAMFDGADTLLRPDGYREWVFIGTALDNHDGAPQSFGSVYMNRAAYKEYARTGKFPEGTTLVRESAKPRFGNVAGAGISFAGSPASLQVSVKDASRFEGGWGFFNFNGENGALPAKAQALPDSAGCRSCHKTCAETDQVFTQFYPILKSTRA